MEQAAAGPEGPGGGVRVEGGPQVGRGGGGGPWGVEGHQEGMGRQSHERARVGRRAMGAEATVQRSRIREEAL